MTEQTPKEWLEDRIFCLLFGNKYEFELKINGSNIIIQSTDSPNKKCIINITLDTIKTNIVLSFDKLIELIDIAKEYKEKDNDTCTKDE